MQLERIDQKSISTRTKISDIKSTIKKMENTLENNGILIEQAEWPGWEYPKDVIELHASDKNEFFHMDDEMPLLEDEEASIQTHQSQNTQNW